MIWNIENMSEVVNIELLRVCCQTTFVPMRPAVPHLQCSQFSWANAWGRQSWCGSTPLSFKIRTWLDMNRHDFTTKRPCCKMMYCNVYMLDTCEESGPAVSKLAIWPLPLLLEWNHLKRRYWKRAALRPFTSAVWYFSFAKFYPLTEVDIAIWDDVLMIVMFKFLQIFTDILCGSSTIVPRARLHRRNLRRTFASCYFPGSCRCLRHFQYI